MRLGVTGCGLVKFCGLWRATIGTMILTRLFYVAFVLLELVGAMPLLGGVTNLDVEHEAPLAKRRQSDRLDIKMFRDTVRNMSALKMQKDVSVSDQIDQVILTLNDSKVDCESVTWYNLLLQAMFGKKNLCV